MNRRVNSAAFLLIAMAILLITARIVYGGQTIPTGFNRQLWRVTAVMDISGKGERAKIRLTLPRDTDRQTIYNENFESDEMDSYIRERRLTKNRIGFWRSEILDGSKTIKYTFSAHLKSMEYGIPPQLEVSRRPATDYPPVIQEWLDASKYIQSRSALVRQYLSKIKGRERKTAVVVRKIYDFVRGEVKYRSEKGSKDARATLTQLIADCGGQARLFVALSRKAGIPSRIVGGLVIEQNVKKITHVWAENYIGDKWIPFDVVNGHFAFIPHNYLEIYRGDYPLVKHIGLSRFDYYFVIEKEKMPPVDQPWSLYALPFHFQSLVRVLILIPVGALIIALMRVVVGVPTFGTFTPILLALAFREISLWNGLLYVSMIVLIGYFFRTVLDQLKILIIPRLSIIVTMVVILILATMMVGTHIGHRRMLYVSLFPIVILTWTIERFSVLQIEDGTVVAIKSVLGTALVAIAAYYVMEVDLLRTYLFAFPEILFAMIGILLLLGRYTGIRLTELWRFKELRKTHPGV